MSADSAQAPVFRVMTAIYLLVLLSVATFSFGRSPTPVIVMCAAVAVSWLLMEQPRKGGGAGWIAPRLVINLGLFGAACNLLWEIISNLVNDSIILALGHFIIAIIICKLFERKERRDVIQIMVLSMLVVVSGTMFAPSSLLFAILLAAYLAVLAYIGIAVYARFASEYAAVQPQLPRVLNSDARLFRRDLKSSTKQVVLCMVPAAAIVFLMIPRSRTAALGGAWGAGLYQTGFTDTVQGRDYGQLAQSDAQVMQVTLYKVVDGAFENVGAEYEQPYFRAISLDSYNPIRRDWVSRAFDVTQEPMSFRGIRLAPAEPDAEIIHQEYTLFTQSSRGLFFMDFPVWIGHPMHRSGQIEAAGLNPSNVSIHVSSSGSPLHYAVDSVRNGNPAEFPGADSWPMGILRQEYNIQTRQGPLHQDAILINPRVMDLARSILTEEIRPAPDEAVPPDKVQAVAAAYEVYLRRNYRYSLSTRAVDQSLDPWTDFLLNRKAIGGTCDYFAAGMVMLCRAVGINARIVAGYHGGEFINVGALGGYYVVRQKDAHAWVEVFVPGSGWQRNDPTPGSDDYSAGVNPVAHLFHQFIELMQNAWLSTVVTFDNDSREVAWNWLSGRVFGLWDVISDSLAAFWSSLSTESSLGVGLRVSLIGPVLGLIVVGWWLMRRWRKDRRFISDWGPAPGRRHVRLSGDVAFLDELLRLMARLGTRRQDMTPHEFIDHLSLGQAAGEAHWLVATAYALRFGALKVSDELRLQISEKMGYVREILNQPATSQVNA